MTRADTTTTHPAVPVSSMWTAAIWAEPARMAVVLNRPSAWVRVDASGHTRSSPVVSDITGPVQALRAFAANTFEVRRCACALRPFAPALALRAVRCQTSSARLPHPRATEKSACSRDALSSASTRPRLPSPASNRHRSEVLGAPLLRLVDKPYRMIYDGDIRGFVGVGVS